MAQIQYQSGSSEGEALMEQRSLTADSVQHSRLLLSVHAAAHEEALHAISLAAADCDITVRPRYPAHLGLALSGARFSRLPMKS